MPSGVFPSEIQTKFTRRPLILWILPAISTEEFLFTTHIPIQSRCVFLGAAGSLERSWHDGRKSGWEVTSWDLFCLLKKESYETCGYYPKNHLIKMDSF